MIDYRFAYLLGTLFLGLPVWIFLFYKRKDLRRAILTLSVIGGLVALVSGPVFMRDYWRPETIFNWPVLPEDFLFGFIFGGIGASIYETILGQRLSGRRTRGGRRWPLAFVPIIAVMSLLYFSLTLGFNITAMNAFYILTIGLFSVIILQRNDLLPDAIGSGVFMGVAMTLGYVIFLQFFPEVFTRWWYLKNLSGIFLGPIPIEEIVWAFGAGLVFGPIYEYVLGYRFRNISHKMVLHKKRRRA